MATSRVRARAYPPSRSSRQYPRPRAQAHIGVRGDERYTSQPLSGEAGWSSLEVMESRNAKCVSGSLGARCPVPQVFWIVARKSRIFSANGTRADTPTQGAKHSGETSK